MSLIFFPTLIGFVSHVDLKKMPMSPCQIKGSRALTLYKCHISDTMIHKLHLSTLRVESFGEGRVWECHARIQHFGNFRERGVR